MQKLIVDHRPTAIPNEPPPGWEREIPLYRVVRDVHAAPKARFRFEPPFTNILDGAEWQYAERDYKAGEVIESTDWPHPSFSPLNFSAKQVQRFFSTQMKSRMQRSPFSGGRIRLDNGLTGSLNAECRGAAITADEFAAGCLAGNSYGSARPPRELRMECLAEHRARIGRTRKEKDAQAHRSQAAAGGIGGQPANRFDMHRATGRGLQRPYRNLPATRG